ncbi:MAG TPA: IS1595 family transposase [Terriglobales bacterium]|nr:IS1595 family transposase [Terriglobales bacterium]
MDPRGFPTTLPEFQKVFPNDEACEKYLESLRWPEGFVCPRCTCKGEPYRFTGRKSVVLRCRVCQKDTSLTAGTVMQQTHTPLSVWFWAAYLVTTQTPGQSALQFQRQLGLSRYETAFQILHKLRSGMVRPERDAIGSEHPVEVDECFVGGETRGEGRGTHDMTRVMGAVEVRLRQPKEDRAATSRQHHEGGKPLKRRVYAGRLRLGVIPNRSAEVLTHFISENIAPSATVRTDGWVGYAGLSTLGFHHAPLDICGDPAKAEAHLPMIHLVFSNLKTWINGTHHGRIEPQHLQAYLNEYVFRFNRRFYPMTAFNSVLGLAARSVPPTYASLYSGEWEHPAG